MRKSVIFFISVIFLISVVVVSFFGLQSRMDQFKTYISDVEITSYDRVVGTQKYLFLDYVGPTDTYTVVRYKITPNEDSLLSSAEYVLTNNTYIDENGDEIVFAQIDTFTGIVEFNTYLEDAHAVMVTVRATDGSNKEDSVIIILRLPQPKEE